MIRYGGVFYFVTNLFVHQTVTPRSTADYNRSAYRNRNHEDAYTLAY
jgi:hypothetical protein